jgi:hypothetical protein
MNAYTKSDQYYEDAYDRTTIEKMKELEKRIPTSSENELEVIKHQFLYKDFGGERAYRREQSIRDSKESDQRKDWLIASTPISRRITCNTCNQEMQVETHSFTGDEKLIFYFTCPKGHLPKRAIYADGSERFIKIPTCSDCGGEFESKKKQTKSKLIFTDTCKECGKTEVQDFEFPTEPPAIEKEDRIKYCISFIGSGSLLQDMQLILDAEHLFEKKEEQYDYNHVDQINIAQLEKKLSEELEKKQFVKFQFEKPKSGRWLTVEFSVQDFSSRDEKSSISTLKKALTVSLFNTNWRLMSTDIYYRLGFITGQIKGFSLEEDLIKIGKEIDTKRKDQN